MEVAPVRANGWLWESFTRFPASQSWLAAMPADRPTTAGVAGVQRKPGWEPPCQMEKMACPLFGIKAAENVPGKTLPEIIDQYFAPQTKVECDGYRSYMNLEGVELKAKRYETNDLHWLHKAISTLKAFLLGTYHGRCTNLRVNPKFCVNAKLWCKIEQKYFKAGAAQAAAAFSTKITALRGDVKGGGVSLRSSRLLTFRLQPVSPACGRQRTPPTVRELRSSPAAFRSTSS